jgi:hypothetical protein
LSILRLIEKNKVVADRIRTSLDRVTIDLDNTSFSWQDTPREVERELETELVVGVATSIGRGSTKRYDLTLTSDKGIYFTVGVMGIIPCQRHFNWHSASE